MMLNPIKNPFDCDFCLENGREVNIDDIKCPICGAQMIIDKSDCSMPISDLEIRSCDPPFFGNIVESKTVYNTTMCCPNKCCTLEFKDHTVTSIGII